MCSQFLKSSVLEMQELGVVCSSSVRYTWSSWAGACFCPAIGALESVSAITSELPGRYSTLKVYLWSRSIILCNLRGAEARDLRKIVSNGLWSVCTVTPILPKSRWSNFVRPCTMASVSFSIWAYLCSVGDRRLELYTTSFLVVRPVPSECG